MATAVGFEGSNLLLSAPVGQEDTCGDLSVFRDGEQVISAWRLSPEELVRVNETGIIWFSAQGMTHPPIFLTGYDMISVTDQTTGAKRPSKAEPVLNRGLQ